MLRGWYRRPLTGAFAVMVTLLTARQMVRDRREALFANITTSYTDKVHEHSNITNQVDVNGDEIVVRPRAFEPWIIAHGEGVPLPCFPPDGRPTNDTKWAKVGMVPHNQPVREGFFFLKTFKTASSTTSGVNLRIARNVARRERRDFAYCKARFEHGKPNHRQGCALYGERDRRGKSFLWAVLRHPSKRAVSRFFHFFVSRRNIRPTPQRFRVQMMKNTKNHYIQMLWTRCSSQNQKSNATPVGALQQANDIIQDYDFIGVTERLEESFVALSMILDLPLGDFLYISTKQSGGYDAICTFIQPTNVTPAMQRFLQSDKWRKVIQSDLALYEAAHRSLDLTIARLGKSRFDAQLARYREALRISHERCAATTVFPCDENGRHAETDCLWNDSGCGTGCLDQVAADLQIDRLP